MRSIFALLLVTSLAQAETFPYGKATALAVAENRPLVVFIGAAQLRPVGDAVVCHARSLEGYPKDAVVVSLPQGDWLVWHKTLEATAESETIEAAIAAVTGEDALDEVNEARAKRGLRPFVRDEGLTTAARSAALWRAARLVEGHTPNDFSHLPSGSYASSTGCAAWPPEMGWGSCCCYENYTYAGAAWAMGRNGKRHMHLFVR